MVAEDKGLRVEESFAHVQTVEFFAVVAISRETFYKYRTVAVVARNRKTYTCTVGQIVVVVAVVAKRETRTQIVTVAAINQSRPRLHGKVLFTRVWTKF